MFARVAVPVPQLGLLTYGVPPGSSAVVGARVVVPLGSRSVTGIVVDLVADAPEGLPVGSLRSISRVLDAAPFVPADVVSLAAWTAEYYVAGIGEAIMAVLPPKTRGERADAHKTTRFAAVTEAGLRALNPALESGAAAPTRTLTVKQRHALELLAGSPQGLTTASMAASGVGPAALARLVRQGLVAIRSERVERSPFEAASAVEPVGGERPLTPEQAVALERLDRLAVAQAFRVALLHGVTGSGKTEVYLRLAASVRSRGRTVLMLVPEIALTPAVSALFRGTFGDRVAVQHSGLSDGERHDQWHRIRRGDVDIVVGTRSAVFAPLAGLGLVIVDEEHDASYKQEESPRYNGRDVAIVRAQRAGALAVLGSATPSMESYSRAASGKYDLVVLERRVLDRPLASVTIVDMRDEYARLGPDVVLSEALRSAIEARLSRGEQSLVLLNRRGFATAVFCRQCGGTLDCPNCSVSLVVHGAGEGRRARCHYCEYSTNVPAKCPACAAPYMEQSGFGTERVEQEVRRAWPGARVARLDRDAVRRKGALTATLSRLRGGEIDLLVGTQMIAKGHDFPGVTLVGVVSADVGLGLADFRASERTFQLLTQVAGRAGRGDLPGEAIVQTIHPNHYSIQLACLQDYRGFYAREEQFRRAMHYPPCVSLVNVIVRSRSLRAAMEDARAVANSLRDASRGQGLRVLGPAPAPFAKLRGEYRAQLLIKGTRRAAMRQSLAAALADRPELARRTTLDVDPLAML